MDEQELQALSHTLSCATWVTENEFINENQQRLEFTDHRFMVEPYDDTTPEQVIMKSAQIGWSVAAIIKSVHAAALLKLNVIYVLPTRNASAEFVVPKVNPMLKRNPVLANLVKSTDNKSLKEVGDRFIHFKGAMHEGEAISTTADLVVSDETDRSDQHILDMYQSRLQASKYRWYWRFSNPSLPGFGVHEGYQLSDQMHWFITCHECGHKAYMGLEKGWQGQNHYIDRERAIYACGACSAEISDEDRRMGKWIAKYPGREVRGYWISQLMIPWVSAAHILKQEGQMDVQTFHNMVLGLPYQASEYMINRENILAAYASRQIDTTRDVVMGCDSGVIKHWVIGTPDGIFTYGKSESWEEVERLRNMYDATLVIDALPDFTTPQALAKKYMGKVFVHYYSPDNSQSMEVSRRKEGTEYGVLQSDRTKLFDLLAADIVNKSFRFFQPPKELEGLIKHCEHAYRIVEADTKGIMKARWETKEGKDDHWLHALAYYRVGLSFMIKSGTTGGVSAAKKSKLPRSYHVTNDKIGVNHAVGDLDILKERSIAKSRKRRL